MAIIYTYPRKSNPNADDLLLISDRNDRNITKTISISSIQSLVSGVFGTGTAGKLASWSSSNMIEDYPYQLAPMLSFSDTINNSTYTMLAYVNGARYGSVIKMTIIGTATSTVVSGSFDIMVNHYQDIHIKSLSGDYSEITLRITSNNNEDYSIEAKTNSTSGPPGTPLAVDVSIFPLSNEIVTRTTTLPPYTGQVYEHTATEGWRYGGTDGGIESSQVIIDGRVGIGISTPTAEGLEVASRSSINGGNTQLFVTGNSSGRSVLGLGDDFNNIVQHIVSHHTQNSISFHTAATSVATNERMRVTSLGNVGIGTTNPNDGDLTIGTPKLHVAVAGTEGTFNLAARFQSTTNDADNTGTSILINSSNDRGLLIKAGRKDGDREVAYFNVVSSVGVETNMLTMGRFDSVYNVGIGTTTPTSKLQVVGLPQHADNAAALAANLTVGAFYRTGDLLKVVH